MSSKRDTVDVQTRQELLAAVWYTCSKIVEEEEVDLGVIASEAFVATLAELVYAQAESLGQDLEAFAKHAGRKAILVDDVKLACRKNEALLERISKMSSSSGKATAGGKQSNGGAASSKSKSKR